MGRLGCAALCQERVVLEGVRVARALIWVGWLGFDMIVDRGSLGRKL